jgi:hypothetical protein
MVFIGKFFLIRLESNLNFFITLTKTCLIGLILPKAADFLKLRYCWLKRILKAACAVMEGFSKAVKSHVNGFLKVAENYKNIYEKSSTSAFGDRSCVGANG